MADTSKRAGNTFSRKPERPSKSHGKNGNSTENLWKTIKKVDRKPENTMFESRKSEKPGTNHGKWKINFKAAENRKRLSSYRSRKIG